MLASYLVRPGVIELREVPTPAPSRGEILVKVMAALTCGTDLKAFQRGHPVIPMPGVFGHEFSGVVAAVGKGVRKFREGDEVMAVHSAPCRDCRFCRRGLYNLCERIMDTKVLGAFAEFVLLPAPIVKENAFGKPPQLSFGEAAFLEPLACVVHGMEAARVGLGDTVVILGVGPIGLLHLLLARQRGARVVITGLEDERLATARQLGADLAVPPSALSEAVDGLTGGIGADCVCECTGQPNVWEESVRYVRKGGTVILFGGCKTGTTVTYDTHRLHYDELTLKGVFHFTPRDVGQARRLLTGHLQVTRLITATLPLGDLSLAFGKLANGEGIKYEIVP
ncbi:MAG: zinc-dependent alcohol dehydrogenase [Chloroflexota bacterium]